MPSLAVLALLAPVGRAQVTISPGSTGVGLPHAWFGSYHQVGGRFGAEDDDHVRIDPASASACVPNGMEIPGIGRLPPEGCDDPVSPPPISHQERWRFGYWRDDLSASVQKIWLDPAQVTGTACAPCTTEGCEDPASGVDFVECQMRCIPAGKAFGSYTPSTYHEVLRGVLAEGRRPLVFFRSPIPRSSESCPHGSLTCTTPACLAEVADLVAGFYGYLDRNSEGGSCGGACELPRDALDRIAFGWVNEPDLPELAGYFGRDGHAAWSAQLEIVLSIPYPRGKTPLWVGPEVQSSLAREVPQGGALGAWLDEALDPGEPGGPGVGVVSYHALWDAGELLATNRDAPVRIRGHVGPGLPLWCTEFYRLSPFGCATNSAPDCGHNRLAEGMLEESAGLLHLASSPSGVVGPLVFGLMEGQGVTDGGSTGFGLVGNSQRDIAGTPDDELFVQNASITHHAVRVVQRELGWNGVESSPGVPASRMLATDAGDPDLDAAARDFDDGSLAFVVVNRGADRSVTVALPRAFPAGSSLAIRDVAPDMGVPANGKLDAPRGGPASFEGATLALPLLAASVTSVRLFPPGVALPLVTALTPGATCVGGGEVAVAGTGFAPDDEVLVAGRPVRMTAARFAPPLHGIPAGRLSQQVSVRVRSRSNGAVSEPVPFTYVEPSVVLLASPASPGPGSSVTLSVAPFDASLPVHVHVHDASAATCEDCVAQAPMFDVTPDAVGPGSVTFTVPDTAPGAMAVKVVNGGASGRCATLALCAPPLQVCVDPQDGSGLAMPAFGAPGTAFRFRFTDSTSGCNPVAPPAGSYVWDLGEPGAVSTDAEPVHAYASPGFYDVAVSVTTGSSCVARRTFRAAVVVTESGATGPTLFAGSGAGPANPPLLRSFFAECATSPSGATSCAGGAGQLPGTAVAYGAPGFGIALAAGAIGGPAPVSAITGPGPGPVLGPHVRAFDPSGLVTPVAGVSFYAYGTLRYGVIVGAGGIDADAYGEILTGAGQGEVFGPHVRAFDYDGQPLSAIGKASFYAYGTPRYGVNVSSADLDADGYDEILTGAGPSPAFAAQVRAFDVDGGSVEPVGAVSFVAFPGAHGVKVAGGDLDGDGLGDVLAGRGPGPANAAEVTAALMPAPPSLLPLPATPFATRYGLHVGATLLDPREPRYLQALAGQERDPASTSRLVALALSGDELVGVAGLAVDAFGDLGLAFGTSVAGPDQ